MNEATLPSSDQTPALAVAEHGLTEPAVLLDQALEWSGFWRLPMHSQRPTEDGRVLILVDLHAFTPTQPVVTRIDLVEHLIDALADRGWQQIAVASGPDSSITWAENRSVVVMADLLGYRYETSRGTFYDVLDLSEDLADAGFPETSALAGSGLSRHWLNADLRIVFAKCKTDQRELFALSAYCLLSVLPLADKDYFYRQRIGLTEVLSALLNLHPPHFAIIDACGAAHGSGGRQFPKLIATSAVIAGVDPLAVDCITALKMGADPAASPLLAGLMAALAMPALANAAGSRARFADFLLPDPILAESTRARDASPVFASLTAPWLQQVDENLFPFKNLFDAKANTLIAHHLADLDRDPAAGYWLISWNFLFSWLNQSLYAWQVSADKDSVMRRVKAVSPETLACGPDDYAVMERELLDLEAWLNAGCTEEKPLRWRYLNHAVVFDYHHTYPVPFEDFVRRVDISRTIQFMNDYIGGTVLPIERDASGRPVKQVERNLYLPQPNYLVWSGGKEIDVSKIESLVYAPERQRMFWKTIKSENQSATYDDGIVTFEAVGDGTRVTIFGRQLFALPPFWELVQLDRYPQLKNILVEDAYTTFFRRTFSNFEALLEQREIAIGRAWHKPKTTHDSPRRPIETLLKLAGELSEAAAPAIDGMLSSGEFAATVAGSRGKVQGKTDSQGFTHFRAGAHEPEPSVNNPATAWLSEFYQGYVQALGRDFTNPHPYAATAGKQQPPGG